MKASRQLPGSAQVSFGERLRMDLSRHWLLYASPNTGALQFH